jgi:hypothetical protein
LGHSTLIWFTAINPGLKLGYEFGASPGVVIGIETSVTVGYSYFLYGGVVGGVQYAFKSGNITHYEEIEVGVPFFGIAVGGEMREQYQPRFRIYSGLGMYCSVKLPIEDGITEVAWTGKYSVFPREVWDSGREYSWRTLRDWLPF